MYISSTAEALSKTFNPDSCSFEVDRYLPFRLVIAGGDDLCIVMDAEYVLEFANNLADAVKNVRDNIEKESGENILKCLLF